MNIIIAPQKTFFRKKLTEMYLMSSLLYSNEFTFIY